MLVVVLVLPSAAVAKPAKLGKTFGSRTLKRGTAGRDVRVLQDYLTRAGYRTTIDGQFGRGTYRTVRKWEGSTNLRVDGRVTPRDARTLRAVVDAAPKAAEPPAAAGEVETPDFEPATVGAAGADMGGAGFVQTSKGTVNPDGTATAPADAPQQVKDIIAAGNEIALKPYVYGGGHASFKAAGYDCSGSISYALHGAGLLKSPLDSTSFESWGDPGPGAWVTVYANAGHAYMVVAGLRFDTSGARGRNGSRWTDEMRASTGFVARHPRGF